MNSYLKKLVSAGSLLILAAVVCVYVSSVVAQDGGSEQARDAVEEPAVTVNGQIIAEAKVQQIVQRNIQRLNRSSNLPEELVSQLAGRFRAQALEQLIAQELLIQEAKKQNININDEQVQAELQRAASSQNLSMEDFEQLLKAYGQDMEEVKKQIREGLTYEKILEKQWEGKTDVNTPDARQYYENNIEQFQEPEQIRASHILISTRTNDPNADKAKVKAEAKIEIEEIQKKIAEGADFAEMAKEHSQGPSAPRGGDLDFFPRGKMMPSFEEAAFSLEVGQVSDIVETSYGYHLIKVTGHKDSNTISFEEAKEGIIENLTNQKKNDIAQQYVESLKENAEIVYPQGKDPNNQPQLGGIQMPSQQ